MKNVWDKKSTKMPKIVYVEERYLQEYEVGNKCGQIHEDTLSYLIKEKPKVYTSHVSVVYTSLDSALASGLIVRSK